MRVLDSYLYEQEDSLHSEQAQEQNDVQGQAIVISRQANPYQLHHHAKFGQQDSAISTFAGTQAHKFQPARPAGVNTFGIAAKAQACHFRSARLSHVSTVWHSISLAAVWLFGMHSSLAKVLVVWSEHIRT